jgi:hypothetical protein
VVLVVMTATQPTATLGKQVVTLRKQFLEQMVQMVRMVLVEIRVQVLQVVFREITGLVT